MCIPYSYYSMDNTGASLCAHLALYPKMCKGPTRGAHCLLSGLPSKGSSELCFKLLKRDEIGDFIGGSQCGYVINSSAGFRE